MKVVRTYPIVILFIIAFVIRLISLNQSLWLDEATTAVAVQTHSFWNIVTQFSPSDFHPPLYYLFMKVWTGIFGYSEVALRMPSVFFSLGAGWMVYKMATYYKIGFWSAAFFLFNPLTIYYSQEARMYSMVTFTIAVSFYYFLKIIKPSSKNEATKDFWFMNIFLVLSFYTFYASAFYIGSVWIYLLILKKYKIFLFSIGSFILPLLLIVPLLYEQLLNSRAALQQVTNWSSVLGNVSVKNLILIPIKFTSGRISFEPKMIYYILAGAWMVIVFGMIALSTLIIHVKTIVKKTHKKEFAYIQMLIFFFVVPLIMGILFSVFTPLLQYFRFQYLIIFLSVLLAFAVCSFDTFFAHAVTLKGPTALIRKKMSSLTLARMIGFFILIGFVSWSLLYLLNPQFHREDWKSLAQELHNEKAPVYMILSSSDPLKYYFSAKEISSLKNISEKKLPRNIIVIPYTSDIHGVNYQAVLQETHILKRTQSFRQLTYEYWQVKEPAENL